MHSSARNQNEYFQLSLAISVVGHLLLFLVAFISIRSNLGALEPMQVYSVTIEGGKSLGGMSQVAKTEKTMVAPPKKVQEPEKKEDPKAEEKKEEPKKKEEKPVEEEKNTVKIPDKKTEEKKTPKKDEKKAKTETKAEIDKRLQTAMQRYLGESSNAGGTGFGAAAVGGKGMGGGIQRPPEFFVYMKTLEEFIKSGWRWNDTTAELIAQVSFQISPDGRISAVQVMRGSGNSLFDDSVLRAVNKASPVPPPPASVYQYFKDVRMIFDPRE